MDFYVNGLIETSIYDVGVTQLGSKQLVTGEILNEGNTNGLFAFVTLEPRGNSNIKQQTQYIDELEPDSPVPFNIPIEFDGEPQIGEHDIRITVKNKDSLRNEHVLAQDTTINYKSLQETKSNFDILQFAIILAVAAIAVFTIIKLKKRKQAATQAS